MQQIAGDQGRTRCYGRLLELKKWGGWVEPLQEIAHPSAHWNRGHIYLTWSDIRQGTDMKAGDVVAFYLYADKKGLGAEDCFPVRIPAGAAFPTAQTQAAMKPAPVPTPVAPQTPPMKMKPPPGLETPEKPAKASILKAQAPPYKPTLCEALGFTDDEPVVLKTPSPSPALPVGPPPGFAPKQDNFSVNFALLADSDDEDEVGTENMAKGYAKSVCGSLSSESSMADASTNAGFTDDLVSVADSDYKAMSFVSIPATPAKDVMTFATGLETIPATAFSDEDDDDEPACEPTPGSSRVSSPEIKMIVPEPAPAQYKILPASSRIYMI